MDNTYPPHVGETHARVLLIESDEATRRFLGDNLAADGYDVEAYESAESARADGAFPGDYDAVIADGFASVPVTPSGHEPHALLLMLRHAEWLTLNRFRPDYDYAADVAAISKPFSYPEIRGLLAALLRSNA
jgi:CheY-like chemotaxis protein